MLLPIAALAYYRDIGGWTSVIESQHLLGFVVAAVTLFVLGLWLKRGSVGAYLEMSEGSNALGIAFLAAAVLAYIYGSWSGFTSWFHFSSLFLLALSYGFFRLDVRFMRLTAPLLAIFAFILPLPFMDSRLQAQPYLWLYIPAAFVVMFSLYARAPRATILPAVIAGAGAIYWLYPIYLPLILAPPAPLALLAPRRLRSVEELPGGGSEACALHGEPGTLVGGFCAMCGRKRAPIRQAHLGFLGLVMVLLTLYALAVTQVPVLALNGGVPSSTLYSPERVTSSQLPPVPAGWLVNSSTPLTTKGDLYSIKQVYVPGYHPETENYTVYYELSSNTTVISNSWGAVPGWNESSAATSVLPLQGRIVTYTSPHTVLLVFMGVTHTYFAQGLNFRPLTVGLSVTRTFRGTSVSNATSQFTNDLQALFAPAFQSEAYSSSWTSYFYRVSQTASEVEGLLAVMLSGGLILWGAYRIELSDSRLDGFITGASDVDDDTYSLLAKQMGAGQSRRTGNEIASLAGVEEGDAQTLYRVHDSLRRLEKRGLVKMTLVERGPDLILAWRAPF